MEIINQKDMNEFDVVNETLCDYLGDVPDTERKRDDNAPKLSSRFLRDNVNAEQRRLIVGYIIRLGVHCYYPSHVIYQTIKLFNVAIDRILVKTDDIQLMALACLWIALKRAGSSEKLPSATVILQLAKDLYINQKKHLLMYEKKIFEAVKFNIQFADPFSLLSYYILNINEDSQHKVITSNNIVHLYFCGSYMIDLSMLDEELCDVSVHVIAMAATELALCLVYSSDIINESWCSVWRRKQLLTEWEERVMISTKQSMLLNATQHWKFSSNVIYKKYMRSRNGRITILVHDKLRNIIC
ncbi:uncharacterized protein LOC105433176 [Pogonomyrmex barbatus]|uniref:Uncharacterized protein LOC105433176 n=1 Tax=Pogonomyrmex barbatus TaxID=144034 RepID=A0A6I9X221_9HYME|nr:uncharacterized protein LOC105433176 [Pogonomyrmex barbatus]